MRTRRLGRTGLAVSELAFGGGWVGGILVHAEEDTRRAALAAAFEAGIDFIDTAPSYGDGESEAALGRLLPDIGKPHILATKARLELAGSDNIAGQIERGMAASLKRLRRDSVDIYQLHNPIGAATDSVHVAADLVIGEVADAFDRLRAQGLTRFIGITALGQAPAVRRVIESRRFDTAQVYYNMLNPSAGMAMPPAWRGHDFSGVIAACRAADVGVLNIRAFAAGAIASDRRHGREIPIVEDADIETEARRAAAALRALGGDYGTRAQAAVRFALANPDIGTVAVGMAEPRHLDEAIAAAELGPLPESALKTLREVYAENFGLG